MVEAVPAVALRPWTPDDEPLLAEWFQCAEVPQYLVPRIRGINLVRADPAAWLPRNEEVRLYALCAPQLGSAPIGIGTLYSVAGNAMEIALVIGEPAIWGQGYGRAAIGVLAHEAFSSARCGRIVARVQPDNARAQRCFRATGFEGRDGYTNEPVWLTLTRTAWARTQAGGAVGPIA